MSIREQLTLAAGLAVALSTAALLPLFQGGAWFYRVEGVILVVVLAGLVSRRTGLPTALQPLLLLAAVGYYVCAVFASATFSHDVLPTAHTFDVLDALVRAGRADIQEFAPPVPAHEGMVLLAVAGVGGVAILVDLVAVVLDRAAVAGLPLLLLFAVPSAVLPGGLGGLPFVLGAIGWLGLLLVEGSERVGRWGTPMRSSGSPRDDGSLARVGRRIGFAAVSLAVVIPAVLPGLDHRLIGNGKGTGTGDGKGASQATTYNPITRLKDQLSLPKPRTLLVYRTDDPAPDYLRMTTLDTFNGSGWSASALVADRDHAQVQESIPTPVGDGGDHRRLTMKLAIDRDHLDVHWLPVPFGPTSIAVQGTWLWDPASQTVFSASRTTKNLPAYTVKANRPLPDRDKLALAEISGIDPGIRKQYGKSIKVTSYVRSLTAAIIKGKNTEYDKATAIQAYFTRSRNGFVYDLRSSQPRPGRDPLEAFLKGKHGFCEQYATAMAALLRVAGIPSRVAGGVTPGTRDAKAKNVYTVTTSDAHAWPEAWFPGTGWIRFEPTPAASGSTIPAYTVPAATTTDPRTNRPSAAPAPSTNAGPATGTKPQDLLDKGGQGVPNASGTDSSGGPSIWLLVPFVAGLLLVLPALLTQIRRRRRWQVRGALTAWSQLQDDATDIGHRWHPADSPRAAAARLVEGRRLSAPALASLDRIATATERVRYAPPGRDTGRDLRADVHAVRTALHESAPFWTRLRALLFPRSTLQWGYHGLGERSADALDAVDDLIATLTRPLRRRTAPR